MWKELVGTPKLQHLTTLQRALDNIAWRFSIRALVVAMPGMLKLALALSFHLEHLDNLGWGLH